ncbi:MAG: PCI domain-containing protein [Candidatus Thorarchaeota archaeon]
MKQTLKICIYVVLLLFGLFELVYGGLGAAIYGIGGVIPESGLPVFLPLTVGIVLVVFSLFMLINTIRVGAMLTRVVEVAAAYKQITIDDIARQSGVSPPNVRKCLFMAIARGVIKGRIEENTFIREEEGPKEVVTIEREVMVARKTPERCYKCGASLNPQEVEWVGPDQIRCPHCGAMMSVKTERI